MAPTKTNAMRLLDAAQIPYQIYTYDCTDGAIDGMSVAAKIGIAPERVFKTLVTVGASKTHYVFVLPVAEELDLKKAAQAVGEKSVAMLPVADINKVTGYIRGGCSPIGMKKQLRTVLHASAESLETIVVSGGKIGTQIELSPSGCLRAATPHASSPTDGQDADFYAAIITASTSEATPK